MARAKLNDDVKIVKETYYKELPNDYMFGTDLLNPTLRKDLNLKVDNGEVGKITFVERSVVDITFSDGNTHTVDKKVIKLI